jgi:hypothetical protein
VSSLALPKFWARGEGESRNRRFVSSERVMTIKAS